MIRVCLAGATGWTGSAVAQAIVESTDLELVGALARKSAGQKLSEALGWKKELPLTVEKDLGRAAEKAQVLVDFTKPDSVKARVLEALEKKLHVVIGTSGLGAQDYAEIEAAARKHDRAVVAAGNFSVTAALAKRFTLEAARYLPHFELIDYAQDSKIDAPSGTVRELAEELGRQKLRAPWTVAREKVVGVPETRGGEVAGVPVHALRLPGFVVSFEALFGQKHERLSIRHDAGSGAEPYVAGALLAIRQVVGLKGLVRGLDQLLFPHANGNE